MRAYAIIGQIQMDEVLVIGYSLTQGNSPVQTDHVPVEY